MRCERQEAGSLSPNISKTPLEAKGSNKTLSTLDENPTLYGSKYY
jgi:hypothetical protein